MTVAAWPVQTTPPTPGQHHYTPLGGAAALMACRDPELLLEGPAGTGKTRSVLEKVYTAAHKYPGMRALLVRKTRESMTESVLVTFEEKVLPADSPLKAGPDRAHRQRYSLPNGSEIVVGGLDKPGKIMSTEYDLIACFESTELTEDAFESLTTRLRNGVMPYQQIIADCNPAAPSHWLNQRATAGAITRILSRHADNPTVTPGYLATLARLTGARRTRLLDGRWAAQEGLVYDFDPAVHECDRADLLRWGIITDAPELTLNPRGVRAVWGGLDWGFTNPGVLWVAVVDGDGRAYFLHEIYQSQRTIDWWVAQGQAVAARWGVTEWIADPSEPAYIQAWWAVPGRITPAVNDIAPGIGLVRQRLQVAGDGRPRLYLYSGALTERDPVLVESKRPVSGREEFDSYHWPKDAQGKELKEVPVKDDDHSLDVIRYLCMAWDGGAPTRPAAVITGPPRFGAGQYAPPGRGWG